MPSELNYFTIIPAIPVGVVNHYIVLPAFSYSGIGWKGASEIVTQFNYSTTKNFIIRDLPVKPDGVNFVPVISWRVGMTSYRYKLWDGVGERLAEKIYNGEVIKKNCKIEIWNIETSEVVSLSDAIQIVLSIRSVPSAMSSTANIQNTSGVEYADQAVNSVIPVGVPTSGLRAWFKADSGIVLNGSDVESWTDVVGGYTVSQANPANQPFLETAFMGANLLPAVYIAGGTDENLLATGLAAFPAGQIFIVLRHNFWSNTAVISGIGSTLRQAGAANQLRGTTGINTVTSDSLYNTDSIVEYSHEYNGATYDLKLRVFDMVMNQNYSATGGIPVAGIPNAIQIAFGDPSGGSNSAEVYISEVIVYDAPLSDSDRASLIQYLVGRYNPGVLAFPFTVDSNLKQETN